MRDGKNNKRRADKPGSIDGIVTDGRRLGVPLEHYRPAKGPPTPSIDDFVRREEGFHPLRQASGGSLGGPHPKAGYEQSLDEPIILDDEHEKPVNLHKSKHRIRNVLKRSSITLAAIVFILGGYLAVKFVIAQKNILRGGGNAPALSKNVDINQLRGEGDGRINVLLLGTGGPGHEAPDLTDTVMLASIDPINNSVALLSIPRDLWVKIPNDGSQKLNAAYAFGKQASESKKESEQQKNGVDLLDKTLESVIGIPIHYHVMADFKAFQQAIDAVGGVSVYVSETLYDPSIAWENNYDPYIARSGNQTFNGKKALLYVKSRETSSDFARAQRQRAVLVALKDKVLSAGTFTNPVKIDQLLSSFGDNIYSDFSLTEISRLNQIIQKVPSNNISSLDLVTAPHDFLTTGMIGGLSIVQPKAGTYNYDDIQNYIRNTLKDSFIAKENAQIAVYNATSIPGIATTNGKTLKSYGYNVTVVDNAPNSTNPQRTTVVDLTKGSAKYTRHYLEERFSTVSSSSVPNGYGINPPAGTGFVIILGKDAENSR